MMMHGVMHGVMYGVYSRMIERGAIHCNDTLAGGIYMYMRWGEGE